VGQLRAIRRESGAGRLVGLSAADPLNLTGIITPGDRVPALAPNRVLYEAGVPILALVAGELLAIAPGAESRSTDLMEALVRKRITPALRTRLAMSGGPPGVPPRARRPRRVRAVTPPAGRPA
jgi:ATP-dependent Lhr-like helicase